MTELNELMCGYVCVYACIEFRLAFHCVTLLDYQLAYLMS